MVIIKGLIVDMWNASFSGVCDMEVLGKLSIVTYAKNFVNCKALCTIVDD